MGFAVRLEVRGPPSASASHCVAVVVGRGPDVEVRRVDARPLIAAVTHPQTIRHGADVKMVARSVRLPVPSATREGTVAGRINRAGPQPTTRVRLGRVATEEARKVPSVVGRHDSPRDHGRQLHTAPGSVSADQHSGVWCLPAGITSSAERGIESYLLNVSTTPKGPPNRVRREADEHHDDDARDDGDVERIHATPIR